MKIIIYIMNLIYFFKKLNVPYLNLNDYYDEMNLTVNDFRDPGHLNRYGGTKATVFLANYLKKNYSFPNRSAEPTWKKINEKYKKYVETYKEKVFKKQLDKELTEGIILKDIEIIKTNKEYSIKLNVEGSKNFDKYNLSCKVFPYNNQELSEYSKSKKWIYDKEDVKLATEDSLITIKITTKIKEIKQLELFLYNTEEYKGVVGNKIILNNISFKGGKKNSL